MTTAPHNVATEGDAQNAQLISRYEEIKRDIAAADRQCMASLQQGDMEGYYAASSQRSQLRLTARELDSQLYDRLGEAQWRTLTQTVNINATNQSEETDTMTKSASKSAAKSTTKSTTKTAAKKAAAADEQPKSELTVELDADQQAAAKGGSKKGGSKKSPARAAAAAAVAATAATAASRRDAAAADKGEAKPAATPAASTERPARTPRAASSDNGSSRTEKLITQAIGIFDRINKATAEKPVTRGDLAGNSDRNIARGLAKLKLVVRLEDEGGRNIRYHALAGLKVADPHQAIRDAVTKDAKVFA
jgi:hypothetical protein